MLNIYIIGVLHRLIVILIICSLCNCKSTHLVSEIIHTWVVICIHILVVELLLGISIWVIVVVVIVEVVILLVSHLLNLSSLHDLILVELIDLLSARLVTGVSLIIAITVRVMIPIFLFPCFRVVESLCLFSGGLI